MMPKSQAQIKPSFQKYPFLTTGCSKKKGDLFEHLPQERALNISSKNSI